MNEVVDRILNSYASIRPMDEAQFAISRQRISRYIETLFAAGQNDTSQLTVYGLAYLQENFQDLNIPNVRSMN